VSPAGAVLDASDITLYSGSTFGGGRVASDGSGWLVTWPFASLQNAFRVVSGAGVPAGSSYTALGEQSVEGDVAFGGGAYTLVYRGGNPFDQVRAIRVDSSGTRIQGPVTIVSDNRDTANPSLDYDGTSFFVARQTGGGPEDIAGTFVSPGLISLGELSVSRSASNETIPAVAYNGSVYTGVLVYIGFLDSSQNGLYFVGGTSAGAPQWAAITAIVNQANGGSQGYLNPALYAIAANPAKYAQAFHDVTIGNNAFFGPGFAARPAYDLPTGLGSPNVAGLIAALK